MLNMQKCSELIYREVIFFMWCGHLQMRIFYNIGIYSVKIALAFYLCKI